MLHVRHCAMVVYSLIQEWSGRVFWYATCTSLRNGCVKFDPGMVGKGVLTCYTSLCKFFVPSSPVSDKYFQTDVSPDLPLASSVTKTNDKNSNLCCIKNVNVRQALT